MYCFFNLQVISWGAMGWVVEFAEEFDPEFDALPQAVQDKLLARLEVLEMKGPTLGRPYADTLEDSQHSNMKELRFDADDGVWRVAYAFDRQSKGIVLVAGDKAGVNERRFYKDLIATADARFTAHLERREQSHGS